MDWELYDLHFVTLALGQQSKAPQVTPPNDYYWCAVNGSALFQGTVVGDKLILTKKLNGTTTISIFYKKSTTVYTLVPFEGTVYSVRKVVNGVKVSNFTGSFIGGVMKFLNQREQFTVDLITGKIKLLD